MSPFKRESLGVLRIFSFSHEKDARFEKKDPSYATITKLFSGSMIYCFEDCRLDISRSDIFFAPPGRSKRFLVSDPQGAAGFSIHIDIDSCPEKPFSVECRDQGQVSHLLTDLHREWLERGAGYRRTAAGNVLCLLGLLEKWAASTTRHETDDMRIKQIQRRIFDSPQDPIDMEYWARELKLTPSYLGVLFKKKTGISLRNFANAVRIQKAKDLLATGHYSPSEAAYQCGFEDIFYFSKVFKEQTGLSPRKWISSGFPDE